VSAPGVWWVWNRYTSAHVALYRASGGRVGGRRQRVAVRQASSEEKAEVWPRLVEAYPPYADYQARSTRDIPVIRLSPV
jgi:F420H(2)-dependent quinone reductase